MLTAVICTFLNNFHNKNNVRVFLKVCKNLSFYEIKIKFYSKKYEKKALMHQ